MANQSITVPARTAKSLIALLEQMAAYEESLRNLRAQVLKVLPEAFLKYGSKLWWEKEEYLADEDIRQGRVSKAYNNVNELIKDLKKGG